MKIIELKYPETTPADVRNAEITLALGFFDGFHRGHQALVREAVYRAEQNGTRTAVYTFDRYPKETHCGYVKGSIDADVVCEHISPEIKGLLQTQRQKLHRIEVEGIDYLLVQTFSEAFKVLSPEAFLEYLCEQSLRPSHILVGEDFRFGKDGAGTVDLLRRYCRTRGIRLTAIPCVAYGGEAISSTRIREAIRAGEFTHVSRMLGRNYKLRGEVIHGNRLARTFDFPTANFRPETSKILPPFGVYATLTKIDGRSYPSITNIGVRPTVNATDPDPLVETTIFGASMDLYGTFVEVDFLQFIRPEMRFRSFLIMTTQIHKDIEEVRARHASSEDLHPAYEGREATLYLCPTERFREGIFDLYFYLPRDARRTAARLILSRLLTSSSARYPARRDFLRALDACYGAKLETAIYDIGTTQVVRFHLSAISRGLEGRRPLNEAMHLLMNALAEPHVDEEGLFSRAAFEAEKKSYLADRMLLSDSKSEEASRRLSTVLFGGTELAYEHRGEPERIAELTLEDVRETWHELRSCAQIDAVLAGSYTQDMVTHCIEALKELRLESDKPIYDLTPGRRPAPAPFYGVEGEPLPLTLEALESRLIRENYPGRGHSHVRMAFSGLPPYVSSDIVSFRMMWKLLGEGGYSRLMTRLRKKTSEVYLVEMRPDIYTGMLMIEMTCGPDHAEDSVLFVLEEIARLQTELIREEELNEQRRLIDNEYRMAADNLESLVFPQYAATITGCAVDIIDRADLLRAVSPRTIRRHAQALSLHKVFIYEAEDGQLPEEGEQDE